MKRTAIRRELFSTFAEIANEFDFDEIFVGLFTFRSFQMSSHGAYFQRSQTKTFQTGQRRRSKFTDWTNSGLTLRVQAAPYKLGLLTYLQAVSIYNYIYIYIYIYIYT